MLTRFPLTLLTLASASVADLYQPLRNVESRIWSRGKNVPYYTCGDQQQSCEQYDQPVSQADQSLTTHLLTLARIYAVLSRCPVILQPHHPRYSAVKQVHRMPTVAAT